MTDYILMRSIWMCLTGRVIWRGTSYGPDTTNPQPDPVTADASDSSQAIS